MSIKNSKENNSKTEKPTKFEYIFEDEESKSIWKYDLKKQPNGPISVETHWKAPKRIRTQKKKRKIIW
jgi:hypothetical protein